CGLERYLAIAAASLIRRGGRRSCGRALRALALDGLGIEAILELFHGLPEGLGELRQFAAAEEHHHDYQYDHQPLIAQPKHGVSSCTKGLGLVSGRCMAARPSAGHTSASHRHDAPRPEG